MNVLLPLLLLDNYKPSSTGELQTFFWRTTNVLPFLLLENYEPSSDLYLCAGSDTGGPVPSCLLQVGCPPPREASLIQLNPPTRWNNDWSARLLSLHDAEEPLERLPEREVPVACRQSGGKQVADDRTKPSSPLAKLSRIDSIAAARV